MAIKDAAGGKGLGNGGPDIRDVERLLQGLRTTQAPASLSAAAAAVAGPGSQPQSPAGTHGLHAQTLQVCSATLACHG